MPFDSYIPKKYDLFPEKRQFTRMMEVRKTRSFFKSSLNIKSHESDLSQVHYLPYGDTTSLYTGV